MGKAYLLCLILVSFSVCLFLGCDNSKKEPDEMVKGHGAKQEVPSGNVRNGGVFKIGWSSTSSKFGDPLDLRGQGADFMSMACQTLIAYTDKPGVFEPLLAESWELAPDKTSYTFHLRKGVKFHDGSPFNAEVVKWNHERVLASNRPTMQRIKSIEIINDYTIKYHISEWDNTVLNDFRGGASIIISRVAFEKNGIEWVLTNPIGTGPFILYDYKRSSYHKYKRNKDYWQKGLPYLDGVEIHSITDPMTQLAAFKKGEMHALREIDVVMAEEIEKLGNYNIEFISGGHMILWFNNTSRESYMSDLRVREALEYAVNKEEIALSLGKGYVNPIYEILFGAHAAGNPGTTPRKYDPDKARKLLDEAGCPAKMKMTLTTVTKFYTDFVVALQDDLAKVGIELTINRLEPATWRESVFNPVVPNHLLYDRQRGGTASLLQIIKEDFYSSSIYFPGVKRPEVWDKLITRALMAENPGKMIEYLDEVERKGYEEAMFVPLWDAPDIVVTDSSVKFDKSKRGSVWYAGGNPLLRMEFVWFEP